MDLEKENIYCIYKHTSPKGKSYIGITKNTNKRFGTNGNGYKNQPKFWNAIQKYGWENFTHEIIEDNLPFEQACLGEELYIEIYDSINNGYNICTGGMGVKEIGNKKVIQFSQSFQVLNVFKSLSFCSEKIGLKSVTTIRNWCIDKKIHCGYYWRFFDDCKDLHINESSFDEYDLNYNYINFNPYSDKIEKIHNSKIGKRSNNRRKINQYSIDGTFIKTWDSIIEAVKYYNIPNDSAIIRAIKRNYNCFGYRWKYYNNDTSNISPNITKNRKIIQLDFEGNLIKEFENSLEVEKETGFNKKRIADVCSGNKKSAYGYIWRYKN